jgi:hypothetical protein
MSILAIAARDICEKRRGRALGAELFTDGEIASTSAKFVPSTRIPQLNVSEG